MNVEAKLELDEKIGNLFSLLSQIHDGGINTSQVSETLSKLESEMGQIPAFLRALLVTDGTVTMALEAYFAEPISINTLRQGRMSAPCSLPALEVSKNEDCFFREVELKGAKSGLCYGHASSILNKNAIDADLFEQLVSEDVGIGVILRNLARGSYREVLALGAGNVMAKSDLRRTYSVSINALPAILITEEFQRAVFL
ncbi:MAG: chorismate-pyruvate lyase [Candidatus Azotimanducaceae bacterium]|jgi:chorismate-pyruvate lyase